MYAKGVSFDKRWYVKACVVRRERGWTSKRYLSAQNYIEDPPPARKTILSAPPPPPPQTPSQLPTSIPGFLSSQASS